ncbi:MAG TPA: hypothetical protein VGB91_08635 [Rhizomicrobium sp.]
MFGRVYSSNITPDPQTGIGRWSADDFYNALHDGVRPDGAHLYPAFPYSCFTHIRNARGNRAPPVTVAQVAALRTAVGR